ncbi:hypothetical protein [Kibdelosporangium phytohabitans]|uniref:hypothetical protein n=1 Tax=Kibdelosporangium phytohabitans TaxID=860235 RepID=UPI0019FE53A9|nr:hypothetical protein [Kibdelosporangium phytohabitans]MBE1470771.1 hypothetical protein [Kibdelosporangium phytohabitans]
MTRQIKNFATVPLARPSVDYAEPVSCLWWLVVANVPADLGSFSFRLSLHPLLGASSDRRMHAATGMFLAGSRATSTAGL